MNIISIHIARSNAAAYVTPSEKQKILKIVVFRGNSSSAAIGMEEAQRLNGCLPLFLRFTVSEVCGNVCWLPLDCMQSGGVVEECTFHYQVSSGCV